MATHTHRHARTMAAILALLSTVPTALADEPLGPFGGDVQRREISALKAQLAETKKPRPETAEWKTKAQAAEEHARKIDLEKAEALQEVVNWKAKAEAAEQRAKQAEAQTAQPDPALSTCQASIQRQVDKLAGLERQLAQCQKPSEPAAAAAKLPRVIPKPCPECPEMVELPRGEFWMGSPDGSEPGLPKEPEREGDEGPRHKVTIGYRLAVGRYEVTKQEFDRYLEDNPRIQRDLEKSGGCGVWTGKWEQKAGASWRNPGFEQTPRNPVVCVSWNDVQGYVSWLNRKAGLASLPQNQQYRLLSEAEWEYAARAGTTKPFSTGDCITTTQANYDGNYDYNGCGAKTGVYPAKTQPVGFYPERANLWDLFDLHGNVWEWVQDCYHDSYNGAPRDGTAWGGGTDCANSRRVLRGGSWNYYPRFLRSADRSRVDSGGRDGGVGFRLARTLTS